MNERQKLSLPAGAKLLSVGFQGGGLFVWVLGNFTEDAAMESRTIEILTTGDEYHHILDREYLGTVHYRDLVLHVFEVK